LKSPNRRRRQGIHASVVPSVIVEVEEGKSTVVVMSDVMKRELSRKAPPTRGAVWRSYFHVQVTDNSAGTLRQYHCSSSYHCGCKTQTPSREWSCNTLHNLSVHAGQSACDIFD
jgi:hypothetical protein